MPLARSAILALFGLFYCTAPGFGSPDAPGAGQTRAAMGANLGADSPGLLQAQNSAPQPGAPLAALALAHTAPARHGHEGLTPLDLAITNRSATPLSCQASLAHWYSLPLGQAGFGVTLSTRFWVDRQTGEVVALNMNNEQMSVERIWCGPEGADWTRRFDLPLERRAHAPVAPLRYACQLPDSGALSCQPVDAP